MSKREVLDEFKEFMIERLKKTAEAEGWSEERLEMTLKLLDGIISAFKASGKQGVKGYLAGKVGEIQA